METEADNQKKIHVEDDDDENELLENPQFHIFRASMEWAVKMSANALSVPSVIDIIQTSCGNKRLSDNEKREICRIFPKLQKRLENVMMEDIEKETKTSGIFKAAETVSKLKTVAASSDTTWRPENPYKDLKSHEAECEVKHCENLQELIQNQEADIQTLKQRISHERLLMENLTKNLHDLRRKASLMINEESVLPEILNEMVDVYNRK